MASGTKTGLLPLEEHHRIRPAVFEDFLRQPSISAPEQPPESPPPAPVEVTPAPPSTLATEPVQEEEPWQEDSWQQELQAAYERGFEDGKTATAALYEAEFRRYQQWLQRFDEIARSLRLQLQQLEQQMEHAAVRLAFVLAEHILGNQLRGNPEALLQLLRQALKALPDGVQNLRIRVHPETLQLLQDAGSLSALGQEEGITLVADPEVDPIGCIIESPWGSVDAQLREQLQSIQEQLQC